MTGPTRGSPPFPVPESHPPPPNRSTALCAAPTAQRHRVLLQAGRTDPTESTGLFLPFPAINSVSRPPPVIYFPF